MTRHKYEVLYLRTEINWWHKLTSFCIKTLMADYMLMVYWLRKLLSTHPSNKKALAEISVNISWQLNLSTKEAFSEHSVPMTLPPTATLLSDDQIVVLHTALWDSVLALKADTAVIPQEENSHEAKGGKKNEEKVTNQVMRYVWS